MAIKTAPPDGPHCSDLSIRAFLCLAASQHAE
jgi:hypothetical protein